MRERDEDYAENTRLAYELGIWPDDRPPPDGVPTEPVTVLSVEYGANGTGVDVTEQVVGKRTIAVGNSVFHCDPCPGVVKALTITYLVGPVERQKVIPEGTVGTIP